MHTTLVGPVDATAVCDLLVFDVGAERFAMPLASVDEVVDGCLLESSGTGSMAGILRVRAELLAAFDPASVLKASRSEVAPVALVLASSRGFIALLVDSAEAAPQVDMSQLRTPPSFVTTDRVLDGVLRVGRRWVGLVNAAALVDALLAASTPLSTSGHHGF